MALAPRKLVAADLDHHSRSNVVVVVAADLIDGDHRLGFPSKNKTKQKMEPLICTLHTNSVN